MSKRPPALTRAQLAGLCELQGWLCAGCGKPMLRFTATHRFHSDMPSTDHVVPHNRGGSNRIGNFVAMHMACNEAKGDDIPTGCELIWLLAVNNRLGVQPMRW